jgi:hypothetical protein
MVARVFERSAVDFVAGPLFEVERHFFRLHCSSLSAAILPANAIH